MKATKIFDALVPVAMVAMAVLLLGACGSAGSDLARSSQAGDLGAPESVDQLPDIDATDATVQYYLDPDQVFTDRAATTTVEKFLALVGTGVASDYTSLQPRELAERAEVGVLGRIVGASQGELSAPDSEWEHPDTDIVTLEVEIDEVLTGTNGLAGGDHMFVHVLRSPAVPWQAIAEHIPDERVVLFVGRDHSQRYRPFPQGFLIEVDGRLVSVQGQINEWVASDGSIDTMDELRNAISD